MAIRASSPVVVALGIDCAGKDMLSGAQEAGGSPSVGLAKSSFCYECNRNPKADGIQWPETCFGHKQK